MARRAARPLIHILSEYGPFVIVLAIGLYVWVVVFEAALTDYLDTDIWRFRAVWLGSGDFEVFGYVITYQMEGYSDYSFFYVHWGNNLLRGVLPYSDAFGQIYLDGVSNSNGLYIFPPLYAYLYGLGIALGLEGYSGIGFLLAAFGYLTAFPVYGLGRELSGNRHVGEAAALTYLLNPNVLYHIDFVWLNPSPFIFFFFLGFYLLVRGHRHAGTLSIVTAALFKQMAWFLGIPLVVYLLVRPRAVEGTRTEDSTRESSGELSVQQRFVEVFMRLFRRAYERLDIPGFLVSVVLVLSYVLAVVLPFLVTCPSLMLRNISLAAGGFPLESFTDPPGYGSPMRLQVLPVMAGLPEIAQVLDDIVYSGFLLTLGVLTITVVMLAQVRDENRPVYYARRLLFLTLILMLWVHLTGPRGVYKYYFTLFAPFFSIFSSVKMVSSDEESVGFSLSMLWLPLAMSLLILLPDRNVYLLGVILITVGYLAAEIVGAFWYVVTAPTRWLGQMMRRAGARMRAAVSMRIRHKRAGQEL